MPSRLPGARLTAVLAALVAGLVPLAVDASPARAGPALGDDPYVAAATHPSGNGLWLLDGDGQVFAQGRAFDFGDVGDLRRAGKIGEIDAVDIVPTKSGRGYWIFDRAGGAYAFGDAAFYGSLPGVRAADPRVGSAPVVAAAVTPSGGGYYMLDAVGGIFSFGDAAFYGSVPGLRNAGVSIGDAAGVAFAVTPSGGGYVVMDAVGGLFTFGNAVFFGSIPGLRREGVKIGPASVRGVVIAADGGGYWMTDSAGGVFSFGSTSFHGSMPGRSLPFDLVDQAVLPDGSGYWMMDRTGRLAAFANAEQVPNIPTFSPSTTRAAGADLATSSFRDFGSHALIKTHDVDGAPVRLNPCRTHRYVILLGSAAPPNGADLIHEAVRQVSAETGIPFLYSGPTSESFFDTHGRTRVLLDHPGYGKGWTPILITLEPWGSNFPPEPGKGVQVGVTGNRNKRNYQGREVSLTAEVSVATDRGGLTPDFADGGGSMGKVLLHEMGHVAGLDHPSGGGQVMSDGSTSPTAYQGGDKEGLGKVGADAGCVLEP